MRDLTQRALDTATSLGAGYADTRVVRRLDESIAIKTGRVEGVASGESEGFGIRVLVDGAWGFASSHILSMAEADRVAGEAVRIARASATALREPTVLDDRPPATRLVRDAGRGGPVHGPARAEDRRPPRRRRGRGQGQGHRLHRVDVRRPARMEDLRRDRRLVHGADDHPRRFGGRGQRRRRRRAPAPVVPRLGRWLAGGRLRVHPEPRPRGARRAAGRRGGRPPDRAAVPERPLHDRPGPEPALPPGPRELRPPDGARPRLRHRGELRRDELPDDRQARGGLPLRLRPHRHRRRRHGARRHGHVRLGRRGRRGPGRAARPERHLRRLPQLARDGAADRAAAAAARCGPTAGTASRSSG